MAMRACVCMCVLVCACVYMCVRMHSPGLKDNVRGGGERGRGREGRGGGGGLCKNEKDV